MTIYIKLQPFVRMQSLNILYENGDNQEKYCFLEDVPRTILDCYKMTKKTERFDVHFLGNANFNIKFQEDTKKEFIKEYGALNRNISFIMT